MSPAVLEKPAVREKVSTDDGDLDRFRHYIPKSAWERAVLWDEEATALCGKKLKPTRDPDQYETCPTCKERYERLA